MDAPAPAGASVSMCGAGLVGRVRLALAVSDERYLHVLEVRVTGGRRLPEAARA